MPSKRIEQIKQHLAEARQRLDHVLDAAEAHQDAIVFSDGHGWTVRHLAVHLADADRGATRQVMGIAAGQEVIPPDFDLDRYNRRAVEKRADMTYAEARAALAASRAELLAWLDTIDDATLDAQGRHASLAIMSVEKILGAMAWHERAHADDIARAAGLEA
ncbi:MAG: DinB family protein [Aggregatilineales bacterium]